MEAKPKQLGPEYGAQFGDASVVAAYVHRPPYPPQVFDVLEGLLAPGARRVLELGSGSGDLTFGLAPHVEHIDAVELAPAMLAQAHARANGTAVGARIRWHALAAEDFVPAHDYALAVAGESLHWMEWSVVLPMIARALRPGGVLAIAQARTLQVPWEAELFGLLAAHGTNRDYRPYDLIAELTRRGAFHELGRTRCVEPGFAQSVDDYVESFHSRNGFSRDRMTAAGAASFDAAVRELVLRHAPDGVVRSSVACTLVWGVARG